MRFAGCCGSEDKIRSSVFLDSMTEETTAKSPQMSEWSCPTAFVLWSSLYTIHYCVACSTNKQVTHMGRKQQDRRKIPENESDNDSKPFRCAAAKVSRAVHYAMRREG